MTILDRTRLTDLLKGIGNPMPHFYIKRRNNYEKYIYRISKMFNLPKSKEMARRK